MECDPPHVAASAAFVGSSKTLSDAQRKVAALFLPLVRHPEAADRIRITSLDDFIRRRPGYDERILRDRMKGELLTLEAQKVPELAMFSEIPPENRILLKLAAVLGQQLRTNLSRSPPAIVALVESLGKS